MNQRLRRALQWVVVLAAFVCVANSLNAAVVLHPGYLTGEFTIGDATVGNVYSVYSANISAWGGGYGASKSVTGDSYTLTVEGGDWEYAVSANAFIRPIDAYYPYTSMYFNSRSIPIPVGETVTNNYSLPGAATLRFQLTITGAAYNSWSAYVYADQYVDPGVGESTYSQGYTSSDYSPSGEWDVPVVPNDNVRIYAQIYVDGYWYYLWWSSPDLRYENIGANDTLVVPLEIVHTVVTIPDYEYGTVQGSVDLTLAEPPSFRAHHVYGYSGTALYENPGNYSLDDVLTGTWDFGVYTYFDNYNTSLRWPYTGGDYLNDRITVEANQTYTKNFVSDSGILSGNLSFSGTLADAQLARQIYASGASDFYDPMQGWVRQSTYGGWASQSQSASDVDPTYRLILNPGPWLPYYVSASWSDSSQGYWQSAYLNVYDYNHYYDGSYYDFGAPSYIAAGTVTVEDRDYCTGSIVVGFLDESGGTLSSPSFSISGSQTTDAGQTAIYASAYGYSNVRDALQPEVEVHGPPGDYNLYSIQFQAQDGTYLSFPGFPISLQCGVRKGVLISGKSKIVVDQPVAYQLTAGPTVTVSGTAADDTGIASITVNGGTVSFQQTGNPENEVSFSYELTVQNGTFTVVTTATDLDGNESFDERPIYVDGWAPTVSIASPGDGQVFPDPQSLVPVEITASDQGYGFDLKVYLDGQLIHGVNGAANESVAESVGYSGQVGPLEFGAHTIEAVARDAAGNVTTTSVVLYYSDPWPPSVAIVAPEENGLYNGTQTIPVAVTAADQGPGFKLEVLLDGNTVANLDGPADLAQPAAVGFSDDIGPLSGGEHVVGAVATDTAGNTAAVERAIRVDSWLPTVTIASPGEETFYSHGDIVPVEVTAADRGYGFSLVVSLDGTPIGPPVTGAANAIAPETVAFNSSIGPLAPGIHVIEAVVTDEAGNTVSASASITVYLLGNAVAKPESGNNKDQGTSTIFVQLPYGLTSVASLSLGDNREISADPDQLPKDVKYSTGGDQLILKFDRTPALLADSYYEVQGRYCPSPADRNCPYIWRAADSTRR